MKDLQLNRAALPEKGAGKTIGHGSISREAGFHLHAISREAGSHPHAISREAGSHPPRDLARGGLSSPRVLARGGGENALCMLRHSRRDSK